MVLIWDGPGRAAREGLGACGHCCGGWGDRLELSWGHSQQRVMVLGWTGLTFQNWALSGERQGLTFDSNWTSGQRFLRGSDYLGDSEWGWWVGMALE